MQRIFDDGTVVNFTYQVFSTANPYIPTLHISTFDPPNLSLEWSGPFTVDSLTDEYLAFSCTDRCIAAQNNLGAHTYEVIAKRQP
ncbi:MAG: hypothetical protein SF052_21280 [Bacteroidia bacterium]|nr:hypothetical protein [Bacteroidia bacterium]